ncbi:hypothetical protein VTN77DRAFT_2126 [Rasamsonia byssochlamydoides]|uniref:uncharacterized protein n=1 Tax=Rasamsonia byssochlamydoides TaxID=89139 RepID=UPI003743D067
MPPTTTTPGRFFLALVALITATNGYLADMTSTHIYNPRWPPHAKFHDGHTLSMGLLLGVSSLYYLFYRSSTFSVASSSPSSALSPRESSQELSSLWIAAWLDSLFWIAQLSAALYPGSLPVDPEFGKGFPQMYFCLALLGMVLVGTGLEHRRLLKREMEMQMGSRNKNE